MFTSPERILGFTHTSDAENLLRPLFGSEKNAACGNAVCSRVRSCVEYLYVQELPV